ncbi:MAG: GDP-mannose 4,6-dehydratase [Pirellulales bacterium]|nr:GDP-mannose 4,6-dehydratase [Pirellulales bacterium]
MDSTRNINIARSALITGGAGFIGSHLAEALLERGQHVVVIDDESTGLVDNLAAIYDHWDFEYVRGSVNDLPLMRRLLREADDVYHLAAAVGVRRIADDPIDSIERNIVPVQSMLAELARLHDAGQQVQLFIASSSEVYGKNPAWPWAEDADLVIGPTNRARWSYGAAKAMDEFLAIAYHRQRNLPVVVGRFFNVIGPRQRADYGMVLPRFIDAALAGQPLVVHNDGEQIRCFVHVADLCQMVIALMNTPRAIGQVFNIGSDEPIRILALAEKVIAAVDPSLKVVFESYAKAYSSDFEDVHVRIPCLDKLRHTIHFHTQYGIDDVIREVVEWKRNTECDAM